MSEKIQPKNGAIKEQTLSTQDTIADKIKTYDKDLILYQGPITYSGYNALCSFLQNNKSHDECTLILSTFGGDANAGYRIARALAHTYNSFDVLVPFVCKSAGTLICVGANSLIIGDKGELGPLDIQITKPDEVSQISSGLDIQRGLIFLQGDAQNFFQNCFKQCNEVMRMNTKISGQFATSLTTGLFAPVFSQLEIMRIGEYQAALLLAYEYGRRLNLKFKNAKDKTLEILTNNYFSHSFVIDRAEARTLFERVQYPTETEHFICKYYKLDVIFPFYQDPIIRHLTMEAQ